MRESSDQGFADRIEEEARRGRRQARLGAAIAVVGVAFVAAVVVLAWPSGTSRDQSLGSPGAATTSVDARGVSACGGQILQEDPARQQEVLDAAALMVAANSGHYTYRQDGSAVGLPDVVNEADYDIAREALSVRQDIGGVGSLDMLVIDGQFQMQDDNGDWFELTDMVNELSGELPELPAPVDGQPSAAPNPFWDGSLREIRVLEAVQPTIAVLPSDDDRVHLCAEVSADALLDFQPPRLMMMIDLDAPALQVLLEERTPFEIWLSPDGTVDSYRFDLVDGFASLDAADLLTPDVAEELLSGSMPIHIEFSAVGEPVLIAAP